MFRTCKPCEFQREKVIQTTMEIERDEHNFQTTIIIVITELKLHSATIGKQVANGFCDLNASRER